MILVIIASTVILGMDHPLIDTESPYKSMLYYCDLAFSLVFGLESFLKIIAFGFILNKNQSYLYNPWNIMDFVIVVLSYVALIGDMSGLKVMKSVRMLRILRPLRMISKNEGLKLAVLCLFNSIKGILNALIISVCTFALYGLFGITFFKGQFFSCVSSPLSSDVSTKWDCLNSGGEWVNQPNNFDNIWTAVLTLFQMSTTEGWTTVLWNGVDSTAIDLVPAKNYNQLAALYFIGFILLGSLFIVNLFVGVVINTFKFEKERQGLNYLLTDTQKEWLKVQLKCFTSKPTARDPEIKSRIRQWIGRVVKSQGFEVGIYLCIGFNTLVLAVNWLLIPRSVDEGMEIVNHMFTCVFTIEAIAKLITYGKIYFSCGWNIFELIIISGTYLQITVAAIFSEQVGGHATILRVFNIGRVLRLVKKAKSLKNIFTTLLVTLPSLANIGFLLFLLLVFYSILGVNLFAKVKLHGELTSNANFQNFPLAFLTLLRCSTGEQWNDLMRALMD